MTRPEPFGAWTGVDLARPGSEVCVCACHPQGHPVRAEAEAGTLEPHRHRYALVPVWTKDGSAIDSWWWCTDHPTGEWAKIEDEPDAPAPLDGLRTALRLMASQWEEGAGSDPSHPAMTKVWRQCAYELRAALRDKGETT